MADPARRRATYADVLAVPAHQVAEIVDGELVVSPRPAPRHALASSVLTGKLMGPFTEGNGGPGGWWILDEPEIHFKPDEPLVPDLAGWKRARLPALPETAYFELAPDWICEVLSPSTASLDRVKKMPIYAAHGVAHAWLIDPLLRTLEVFRLERESWLVVATFGDVEKVRAEPFDAIEINLSSLWSPAPPL